MWICLLLTEQDSGGHVIKQGRENEEKLCISPFYEYPHLLTDVFVPLKIKIQTMR